MSTIPVKDADGTTRQILNNNEGGSEAQVVKVMSGAEGQGVVATEDTPFPIFSAWMNSMLNRVLNVLRPLQMVTSGTGRLSIDCNSVTGTVGTVTTVTTVTTCTTVGTVSNQTSMGGVSAFALMHDMSRSAYNTGIRANIT